MTPRVLSPTPSTPVRYRPAEPSHTPSVRETVERVADVIRDAFRRAWSAVPHGNRERNARVCDLWKDVERGKLKTIEHLAELLVGLHAVGASRAAMMGILHDLEALVDQLHGVDTIAGKSYADLRIEEERTEGEQDLAEVLFDQAQTPANARRLLEAADAHGATVRALAAFVRGIAVGPVS